jgi:hypothetical protein
MPELEEWTFHYRDDDRAVQTSFETGFQEVNAGDDQDDKNDTITFQRFLAEC